MREITPKLQIDCKKKKCGKCHGIGARYADATYRCRVYDVPLVSNKKGQPLRLAQCLSDEAVARWKKQKIDEESDLANTHIIRGGL